MNLFVAFITAFLIGTYSIPIIIKISKIKKIYDVPDERKLNTTVVPTLGGVAIFMAIIISSLIASYKLPMNNFHYIMGGMTIIFFTGMKDDLIDIAPMKKLMLQVAAAAMIIVLGDIRVTNLHGFLGITELNYFISFALTLFIFVVITNGINLIDGIDGLAASVAVVGGTTMGVWFYFAGIMSYSLIAISLVGSFGAFFIFNVFGKKNKIFMGDTGSLLLGYMMTIFVIAFSEANIAGAKSLLPNSVTNPIAMALAIMVIPVFDTARVFLIRTSQKKSPFRPDKNHIHHLLLKLVDKHLTATLYLAISNITIIVLASVFTEKMGLYSGILFVLLLGGLMVSLPEIILKVRETREIAGADVSNKAVKKVRFKIYKDPQKMPESFTNVN